MRHLNIFVVHPSDVLTDHLPNGAGWIVYNYLKGLAERGHTIHVALPRCALRGSVPAGMHLHLIETDDNLFGRLSYIWALRKLLRHLSAFVKFDIVQQFTPVKTGLSFGVLRSGIPLVLGPYSGYWPADADGPSQRTSILSKVKRVMRDSLASLQQRQARALVITCPAAIDRVAPHIDRDKNVHVIGHGIDIHAHQVRDAVPDKASILFLANLEYRKGIFTVLEAFDCVAEAVPECTLEIWGDGTESESVQRRIDQSPFHFRIHRRGRASREKVGQIMRSHSVYCMPSHGEPFGMTLLEAMAAGVPIVTTDCGGPPYIVHQSGGRIVPMRDSKRLADALIEVLLDKDLQTAMGAYNRRRVEQEFDWSKSLDRMESVYEQVLRLGVSAPSKLMPTSPSQR